MACAHCHFIHNGECPVDPPAPSVPPKEPEWVRVTNARRVLTGDVVRVEYATCAPDEGPAIVEVDDGVRALHVDTEDGRVHVTDDLQAMLDKGGPQRVFMRAPVAAPPAPQAETAARLDVATVGRVLDATCRFLRHEARTNHEGETEALLYQVALWLEDGIWRRHLSPAPESGTAPQAPLVQPGSAEASGPEIRVQRYAVYLCDPCVKGEAGECHSPGCSLWCKTAPGVPLICATLGFPDPMCVPLAAPALVDGVELVPCDWCGLMPEVRDDCTSDGERYFSVGCWHDACPMDEVETVTYPNAAEAIAAWNTRVPRPVTNDAAIRADERARVMAEPHEVACTCDWCQATYRQLAEAEAAQKVREDDIRARATREATGATERRVLRAIEGWLRDGWGEPHIAGAVRTGNWRMHMEPEGPGGGTPGGHTGADGVTSNPCEHATGMVDIAKGE